MKAFHIPTPVFMSDVGAAGAADGGDKSAPPGGGDPAKGGEKAPEGDKGGDKGGEDKGGRKAAPTAMDGGAGDKDKQIVVPADFPDDWSKKMAGGDADLEKLIGRYKSPAEVAKALKETQGKLRSGKTATDAPDGTKDPDGLKAWRKENGIPEDATGYELPKPIIERMTDADKPVLQSFTEFAHKKNLPPGAVATAAEWYIESQDAAFAAQNEADKKAAETTEDSLRKEWGGEYKANMEVIKRFQGEITPGVNWSNARLPADESVPVELRGKRIGDIPEVAKMMVDLALQKYGDVNFIGGANANALMSRKAEIEKFRSEHWQDYQGDPKMQAEYLDILKAEEKAGRLK